VHKNKDLRKAPPAPIWDPGLGPRPGASQQSLSQAAKPISQQQTTSRQPGSQKRKRKRKRRRRRRRRRGRRRGGGEGGGGEGEAREEGKRKEEGRGEGEGGRREGEGEGQEIKWSEL
jgi:hypothetical protein